MYRNSNVNNGGRSVPNAHGSGQGGHAHPNGGTQVRVNNHNGNPNPNGRAGTGAVKANGGRSGNPHRPS